MSSLLVRAVLKYPSDMQMCWSNRCPNVPLDSTPLEEQEEELLIISGTSKNTWGSLYSEKLLWFIPNINLHKHLMWQRPASLTDLSNFSSSRPEHFAWKVCSYFFLSVDFSLQMPKREINCGNRVQSSQSKGFGQCLSFVSQYYFELIQACF